MDSAVVAGRVVTAARRYWPKPAIYARARDAEHARHLIAQGESRERNGG